MDKNSLEELAQSIREQGLISPILVRPIGKNRYEIIAGERRYQASKMAGLKKSPYLSERFQMRKHWLGLLLKIFKEKISIPWKRRQAFNDCSMNFI